MSDFNSELKQAEEKAIAKRDVKFLCKAWFKVDVTPNEEEIIRTIAFKEHKRICITAFTRYGKSLSVSLGLVLYLLFNENKKINLIAPTGDQSVILREYVSDYMSSCSKFKYLIPQNIDKIQKLRNEFNKSRVRFENDCRLRVFSAEGEAKRLMGWGGDLIVMDESCMIPFEVYRQKISRMLGDNPDSILVEIGNPWDRLNQFWEHWNDPDFKKIHIPWCIGCMEGRISLEFIIEQKKLLTSLEFDILYKAIFPEDTEDTLIRQLWINKALKGFKTSFKGTETVYGLDVAEFGNDYNVLTKGERNKQGKYKLLNLWWSEKKDIMQTVGWVLQHIPNKKGTIFVDSTGVGAGVYARLKERNFEVLESLEGKGLKVVRIMFGSKPTIIRKDAPEFMNFKSQGYWNLRNLFQEGKMSIIDKGKLKLELNSLKYELTSGEKIKIIKPDKSPDFADSLMLMTCGGLKREFGVVVL